MIAIDTHTASASPEVRTAAGARLAGLAVAARDPRHFQIVALGLLLMHGLVNLDFEIGLAQLVLTAACALGTQWLADRLAGYGSTDLRSPLISALSLCLLLRVEHLALAALAAVLAIASKFLLRTTGGHVFNPTALAIAVSVLAFDGAWVSPGQWGHAAYIGLAVAGLGLMVLSRAKRLDSMLAFLGAWTLALLARTAFYGDPVAIALHQLGNGAVLLFAFFMITDPRTTPATRTGRVLFALAVAAAGAGIGFGLYRADALILALAACGPLVPLLDTRFPAPRRLRRQRCEHTHHQTGRR